MNFRSLATILAMLASTSGTLAQVKYPPETRNAALRYWTAFAEMQDPLADMETRKLIEKTVTGETAWSETTLGSTLDANAEAIRTMQRGTKLPECDWGLEYSRGPRVPVTLFIRARALAGLNTLEGMRRMAKGDSQGAVNAWLAGIHFSQDLARGEPLIFTLVAMRMLLPNLRVLSEDTKKGQLNEAQKKATKRWGCLYRNKAFLQRYRRFKATENTCSQCRQRWASPLRRQRPLSIA